MMAGNRAHDPKLHSIPHPAREEKCGKCRRFNDLDAPDMRKVPFSARLEMENCRGSR